VNEHSGVIFLCTCLCAMNILIPTSFNKNPYIFQLVRALQKNSQVSTVHTLVPWFFQDDHHFDIIHLQWPESIISKKNFNKENTAYFRKRLEHWRERGSVIVITIHNETPHRANNDVSYELYKTVYQHCDGILHMGEASKTMLRQSFQLDLKGVSQVVIPHGNYDCFPNSITREEARKELDIPERQLVVASIGSIRTIEEYQLLKSVSRVLKQHEGLLLQIGSIGPAGNAIRKRINRRLLQHKRNFRHCGSFIEDRKMQYFLNACDILLVPRVNTLNSGNVALGFTFGKIVIGPDSGVIGEELRRQGNPVFTDTSDKSISQAMNHAVALLDTDTANNNRCYAFSALNWDELASNYIDFYHSLRKEQFSAQPTNLR
jgi:beta-1,4-mannosyltransferase